VIDVQVNASWNKRNWDRSSLQPREGYKPLFRLNCPPSDVIKQIRLVEMISRILEVALNQLFLHHTITWVHHPSKVRQNLNYDPFKGRERGKNWDVKRNLYFSAPKPFKAP
jgi:hypothetical protein